jgi:hypothetical protein
MTFTYLPEKAFEMADDDRDGRVAVQVLLMEDVETVVMLCVSTRSVHACLCVCLPFCLCAYVHARARGGLCNFSPVTSCHLSIPLNMCVTVNENVQVFHFPDIVRTCVHACAHVSVCLRFVNACYRF